MKKLPLLFLGMISLIGCDIGTPPPQGAAEIASYFKGKGVSLTFNAPDIDGCAEKQAQKLWDDYYAMNDQDEKALLERMKTKYASISIQASNIVFDYTGEQIVLMYYEHSCDVYNNCTDKLQNQKDLKNTSAPANTLVPDTQVAVSGRDLTVTPQAAHDLRHIWWYQTTDLDTYANVYSTDDARYQDAFAHSIITFHGEQTEGWPCGNPISWDAF